MQPYHALTATQLKKLRGDLMAEYETVGKQNLKLDMSRGKPDARQLGFADGMLDTVSSALGVLSEGGVDCRNYGVLDGLPEAKKLMAELLGVGVDEIIVGGSSSLNLMYDAVSRAMLLGVYGSQKPWCREAEVKFLCPVPGYDRHFAICEQLGIKMINIELYGDGPDMDQVAGYVNNDPAVKGIWCVPKYANPSGAVYSKKAMERFAALTPAAPDFRIFMDNAYCVHDLYEEVPLTDLFALLKKAGKADLLYLFGSTSKISYAGAGLAAMAGSQNNMELTKKQLSVQTIGYDKIIQLMHARFLGDLTGIKNHMKKHAEHLRPKFELTERILTEELEGLEIARWTHPKGGYFVSLDTLDNCASRVVALCKGAGVVLTPAGASFPYGVDPRDRNIRLAPTFPDLAELAAAARLLCLCVKIAAAEQYLTASK